MTADRYSTWARHTGFSGLGLRLKHWVERTYVDNIRGALGRPSLAGTRLLEIGPGEGHFADVVSRDGAAYEAVEASPLLAGRLRERGYTVHVGEFPAALPAGRRYDVIYLSHVLEHVDTRADAVAVVQRCFEALEPGGYIVVNCPNVLSHKFHFWHSDYTHNFVTTPNRLYFLLSDCGFEVVSERRMVFGFQNVAARLAMRLLFLLTPSAILEAAARRLRPNWRSSPAIYGSENFTTIARRP